MLWLFRIHLEHWQFHSVLESVNYTRVNLRLSFRICSQEKFHDVCRRVVSLKKSVESNNHNHNLAKSCRSATSPTSKHGWRRVLALGAGNNREISNDHLNPSTSSQSSGLKSVRLLEGGSRGAGGVDKSKLSCVPCDDAQNENSNP